MIQYFARVSPTQEPTNGLVCNHYGAMKIEADSPQDAARHLAKATLSGPAVSSAMHKGRRFWIHVQSAIATDPCICWSFEFRPARIDDGPRTHVVNARCLRCEFNAMNAWGICLACGTRYDDICPN